MINFASVVGGLLPFYHGNVNETYKALVKSSDTSKPFVAVVKDLPHRELFNELFAYTVLQELKLPVPAAYIGLVPSTEARIAKAPTAPNGDRLVFVSEEMPSPSLRMATGLDTSATNKQIQLCLEKFVPMIAQWEMLGELYAFDLWVANIDRNLGNLLFGGISKTGKADVWLIDHGKAFTSEHWQSTDLQPNAEYTNKLRDWATPYLTEDNKKNCLKSAISFEGKAKVFDKEAKVDYLSTMFGLDKADSDAAKNFLKVRLGQLGKRSKEALEVASII